MFWATFNPSVLQCPIVLWLAGINVGCSENITLAFCYITTIMNPVTVATFFHEIYREIFDYLLRRKSSNGRFFGPVSKYFGTVKTNGQGMLHLHCWV